MNCRRLVCFVTVFLGFTVFSYAQSLEEVIEARNNGTELMAAGELDSAIELFEKCIELASNVGEEAEEHKLVVESVLPALYLRKAKAILDARDYEGSISALSETITAAERFNNAEIKAQAEDAIAKAYYAVGASYYQAKDYDVAIKNLEQAVARDPNMTGAYFIMGVCFQSMQNTEKMEENYRLAMEKGAITGDTRNAQNAKNQLSKFFYNAGVSAQKVKKWDDSIIAFSKSLEIDDTNADAYYSLATSYNEKKSWDNVISNAEKALELRSGADQKSLDGIYYQLGTAYAGKKDNAKACECFKKVGDGPFYANAKYQIETALKCN